MKSLIQKYDRPGPRYTSYPPVPLWNNPLSPEDWIGEIESSLHAEPTMDLYLHIPYCEKLCYYCGCNRIITRDKSAGVDYVTTLLAEWELYRKKISKDFRIHSLHFGGGTPTFLSPESLGKILSEFQPLLNRDFIGAIEVDPRTCTKQHLSLLKDFGFRRVSLGIQDFDENVQSKINRQQSFALVKGLLEEIRRQGFESINFDLIYGLPGQSRETILRTIALVSELNPDSIAFYSYAHLPSRIPNQRLIRDTELPSPEEKLEFYLTGKKELEQKGYAHIGMDHFAREGSFLRGAITRSFMGYTDKKSSLLVGLGATSIGSSIGAFVQNEKDVKLYTETIRQGKLPIKNGHKLTPLEKEVSHVMQDLFCQGEVQLPQNLNVHHDVIQELEQDGLIVRGNAHHLKVTSLGKNFLRNIAMALDPLLDPERATGFSRTV